MANGGRIVGGYRVLETLGSGAVGAVYRAEHCTTGQFVALKQMHQRLESDPDMQNRFVREVSVLEKLNHPNIVRHIECGLDDGRLYLAMEWVEFGTLDGVLRRRKRLSWREAVECAMQICRGLEHAHERGVIHRDLKPANLFLSNSGLVKVGDFGLARDADLHRLTMRGNTVGSCRYMAPEQVRGEDELTGAVDMYALGCLLYQMLSGEVPYHGATILEIFEHHLYSPIPPLDPPIDDRPPLLDELVLRLLAKDPSQRPGKAGEVREALEATLAGDTRFAEFTPVTSSETTKLESVDELANLTHRLVHSRDEYPQSASYGRWLLGVLGLVAMLAVVALSVWVR